jgi:hypothetical protein
MTTTVVNLQRDPFDVYIGRPGRGEDGHFGNPHVAGGGACPLCVKRHTRSEAIALFAEYFCDRVRDDAFRAAVFALRDKRLGCFCAPWPCHGHVIAAFVDNWSETDWERPTPEVLLRLAKLEGECHGR